KTIERRARGFHAFGHFRARQSLPRNLALNLLRDQALRARGTQSLVLAKSAGFQTLFKLTRVNHLQPQGTQAVYGSLRIKQPRTPPDTSPSPPETSAPLSTSMAGGGTGILPRAYSSPIIAPHLQVSTPTIFNLSTSVRRPFLIHSRSIYLANSPAA